MRVLIFVVLAGCLFVGAPAFARMYQWHESGSGVARLSGDPPPWYRNGRQGPRTLVFENGRLVDDTAIALPREQEEALRNAAFREVDLKREEGAVRMLERAALREARLREERGTARREKSTDAGSGEPAPEKQQQPVVTAEDLDAKAVERMKSLIQEWDKQQKGAAGTP